MTAPFSTMYSIAPNADADGTDCQQWVVFATPWLGMHANQRVSPMRYNLLVHQARSCGLSLDREGSYERREIYVVRRWCRSCWCPSARISAHNAHCTLFDIERLWINEARGATGSFVLSYTVFTNRRRRRLERERDSVTRYSL